MAALGLGRPRGDRGGASGRDPPRRGARQTGSAGSHRRARGESGRRSGERAGICTQVPYRGGAASRDAGERWVRRGAVGPSGAGGGRAELRAAASLGSAPRGGGSGAVRPGSARRGAPNPPRPRCGRCRRAAMLRAVGRELPQTRASRASSAYVPAMLMERPFPKAAADSRSLQNHLRVCLPPSPTSPPRWAPRGFPFSRFALLSSVRQFAAACPSFGRSISHPPSPHVPPSVAALRLISPSPLAVTHAVTRSPG